MNLPARKLRHYFIDGWHVGTHEPTPGRWTAYGKREPFSPHFNPMLEAGDMWFEFGNTEADAIDRLMADIGNE